MSIKDTFTRKSELLIRIEHLKASGNFAGVAPLALEAAGLETQLAEFFIERSAPEDAVVNLVSAASCLVDAARQPQARAMLERALAITSSEAVRTLVMQQLGAIAAAPLGLFEQLCNRRGDSQELVAKMRETVERLKAPAATDSTGTSGDHPGMLLGRIQSGKTRAFIGIIAKAFDEGFQFAIILTKGTQALSAQTIERVGRDFVDAIEADLVKVYDIMHLPKNLTKYHLKQKWIIVVKKQIHNLRRVFEALDKHYPDLTEKRLLIIDDEADYATLAFRKNQETDEIEAGKIAQWIDRLRAASAGVGFLQVTATPYSLYLQPNNREDSPLFHPVRPAFTIFLPTYADYVGGDFFFGESEDPESPAFHTYKEVSSEERDTLKSEDRRGFKIEDVLASKRVAALRMAILSFVVGGSIRRIQQTTGGEKKEKYAFIVHTESARRSHAWQESIVRRLLEELVRVVSEDESQLRQLVQASYDGLKSSLDLGSKPYSRFEQLFRQVRDSLVGDEVMVSVVNSEHQVRDQLDESGQLRLDAPLNVFIGGQILDRGITVRNLIGFYYGRSPQQFQQDTVLQHARLYGNRPRQDLLVTRFYTTAGIHEAMKRIHTFDTALRSQIEKGTQDRGVFFLRRDTAGQIIPCSPNKILASDIVTLRPHGRLSPIGFQTGYRTYIAKIVEELDGLIRNSWRSANREQPVLIGVETAGEILTLIEKTLVFEDADYQWEFSSHIAVLEHLADQALDQVGRGKVWLLAREGRDATRFREAGRFGEPLSYREREIANERADYLPVLVVLRQDGREEQGWRGTPFWWPVIITPASTQAAVFASRTRGDD